MLAEGCCPFLAGKSISDQDSGQNAREKTGCAHIESRTGDGHGGDGQDESGSKTHVGGEVVSLSKIFQAERSMFLVLK